MCSYQVLPASCDMEVGSGLVFQRALYPEALKEENKNLKAMAD